MANVGYKGLDKPPKTPVEIGDPSLPIPDRLVSLYRYLIQLGSYLLKIGDVVNNTLRGKLNCTGTLTLLPNVASTTLSDVNIGGNSVVLLMPTTANASAEIGAGGIYINTFLKGSCVVHHANSAQVDRIFGYAVLS